MVLKDQPRVDDRAGGPRSRMLFTLFKKMSGTRVHGIAVGTEPISCPGHKNRRLVRRKTDQKLRDRYRNVSRVVVFKDPDIFFCKRVH